MEVSLFMLSVYMLKVLLVEYTISTTLVAIVKMYIMRVCEPLGGGCESRYH